MKSIALVVFILLTAAVAFAEDPPPASSHAKNGSCIGAEGMVTTLNQDLTTLIGVQGEWIVNHTLLIGLSGASSLAGIDEPDVEQRAELAMTFGGVFMGYVFNPDQVAHFMGDVVVGGGTVRRLHSLVGHGPGRSADSFFLIEPTANLEVNLSPRSRLDAGLGYRSVAGVTSFGLTDGDLSGLTVSLTFKFGEF